MEKHAKSDGFSSVAVIGCGNMGFTILQGMIEAAVISPHAAFVSDVNQAAARRASHELGAHAGSADQSARRANVILIAVKPGQVHDVLTEIRGVMGPQKTLVSIAAGVTTRKLDEWLEGTETPVIRAMPNLCVKVRQGIIAYCPGKYAQSRADIAPRLFAPLGDTLRVEENLMDFITAVSGSGPGYFFYLAEIIASLCERRGIDEKNARSIVSRLLVGSGRMIAESEKSPGELREMVSSPGGTTLAGLGILREHNLPEILKRAVSKAEERGGELSK